jgi:hypothetical protein
MKALFPLTTAVCLALSAPAWAACPDVTGSINGETSAGLAKDGTHAPLEAGATAENRTETPGGTTTTAGKGEALAKDGRTLPLSSDPNLATSNQDVAAQQQGEKTAAAEAEAKTECVE